MKSFVCKLLFLSSLLFFSSSLFYAQTAENSSGGSSSAESSDDSWYYGKLIKSVTFKGLKNVDSKDVDGVTSGFIGKQFTDEIFADMIDRIYALELFDDILPEAIPGDPKRNTVSVVFTVTERAMVSRIIFTGNKKLRSTELKEALSFKEKDIFVESKVLIGERAVRNLYLEKGYTNAKVTSSYKETEKGMEVTFAVDEGRTTVISKIAFKGNKVFADKAIKKNLKLKEVGVFRKGAFQESLLEADKQNIANFYMNNGYIDAQVIDVTREVVQNDDKKRDELIITFVVEEGEQYTYSGISFVGNEIFSDEKLGSLIKVKQGNVFEMTKFQEGIMAIADLYYENGYTSNHFEPIPTKDEDAKSVSYVLRISENSRSHVEKIIIKGNTKTKENIIARELPIESGDIFSKNKITTGLRNLYNLQYFSAVVPEIVQGSEEGLVDVVLNVEEQSTTSIEFGVTFAAVSNPDDLPLALYAKWQDSNIKGTGKTVGVSTTLATGNQSIDLSFGQNWLFDMPISTSISTSFSHAKMSALRTAVNGNGVIIDDSYYMPYEQYKWTIGFSGGRRWTPDWAILTASAGISGSLRNNIYDENLWIPYDISVSKYANKWGWGTTIWTAFSADGRDVNYNPSKGWFASERLSWIGLIPALETEFYLKSDTKFEKYFTLLDWKITESYDFKIILMLYTQLAFMLPAPDHGIGRSSQLYIDGTFNGRGWTSIYNKVRGKAMWNNTMELRIPIIPSVIAVDGFFDAVAIKDELGDLFSDLHGTDFYFSVGPGVRFLLPQFPLRILFANTFKFEDGSAKWNDNWKFVLSFNVVNK